MVCANIKYGSRFPRKPRPPAGSGTTMVYPLFLDISGATCRCGRKVAERKVERLHLGACVEVVGEKADPQRWLRSAQQEFYVHRGTTDYEKSLICGAFLVID